MITQKDAISVVFFIILITFMGILLDSWNSLIYGAALSLLNVGIQKSTFWYHKRRVSRYPAQALVVVISNTITRFFIVGSLLIWGFSSLNLDAKNLLLGFVSGQLFFLIHQLLVAKNNGK